MITDAALAELAAASYRTESTYSIADIYVCETRSTDFNIVAFRGTADLVNVIRDLAWRPQLDPVLGWCHRGFLRGARSFLREYVRGDLPLVLTGHSLGGALALAVGGLLCAEGRKAARISTFGAPRVGMMKFRRALIDVDVRQYRRGNDPVTELPLALWPFLFQHAASKLIEVGVPSRNPLQCHSSEGYVVDMFAAEPPSLLAREQPVIAKVGTIIFNERGDDDAERDG